MLCCLSEVSLVLHLIVLCFWLKSTSREVIILNSNCERCSSFWSSKLFFGLRLTLMTHCWGCGNAPLLFPLERPSVCVKWCMWSRLLNGLLSISVVCVKFISVCTWTDRRGGRRERKQTRARMRKCLREGKSLIHTAGTVVASPAALTLAPIWSDTSTVDTLLGAASCGRETHFITELALWRKVNTTIYATSVCYLRVKIRRCYQTLFCLMNPAYQ